MSCNVLARVREPRDPKIEPPRGKTNSVVSEQVRHEAVSFAVLRLCFRICRLLFFPWGSSNNDPGDIKQEPSLLVKYQ